MGEELVMCRSCKIEKPGSEMAKARRYSRGYVAQCAECKLAESRAYKAAHRKQIRELDRARRDLPEQRAKEAETRKRFAREHPEVDRAKECARRGSQKLRARAALKYAVQSGRIAKPSSCQDCGRSDLQLHGHHHDYTKPFDVAWVCRWCHGKRHRLPDVEKAG